MKKKLKPSNPKSAKMALGWLRVSKKRALANLDSKRLKVIDKKIDNIKDILKKIDRKIKEDSKNLK